ncbi:MAG: ABC transporter permease subunit [bacterium]
MKRIMAVARYIFKQSFRNKVLNVLVVFAIFAIGFSLLISELAQEAEIKMVTDFGLLTVELFAFITLALALTVQMFEETELKVISLIMVKPINKSEYLIGKFLGLFMTVAMNVLLMLGTLMIILKLRGGNPFEIRMLLSVYYTLTAMSIMTAVAILISVIVTSIPAALIFLFFIFVLGHLTVHLKHLADITHNAGVTAFVNVFYYVLPNLELFNMKDKIYSQDGLFTGAYFGLTAGYALIYILTALGLANFIFKKHEF